MKSFLSLMVLVSGLSANFTQSAFAGGGVRPPELVFSCALQSVSQPLRIMWDHFEGYYIDLIYTRDKATRWGNDRAGFYIEFESGAFYRSVEGFASGNEGVLVRPAQHNDYLTCHQI